MVMTLLGQSEKATECQCNVKLMLYLREDMLLLRIVKSTSELRFDFD